jgi:hypothetical protein
MDSKEIPVGSRQNNVKVLTEIKDDLKKSLDAWEGFLNIVEAGLVGHDWVIAKNVSGPIVKALNKAKQALQTDKECVEPGLEKVFISVERGNINIYDMTDNVIVNVIEHDNKDTYVAIKNDQGKIITKPDSEYYYTEPKTTCSRCSAPLTVNKVCVLCHSHICNSCIDWHCMAKSDTKAIICKECSQLFENCKGDN